MSTPHRALLISDAEGRMRMVANFVVHNILTEPPSILGYCVSAEVTLETAMQDALNFWQRNKNKEGG